MKNKKLIVCPLLSKNTEFTEVLDYSSEYFNAFTGLDYYHFDINKVGDLEFILKMLKKNVDVCKYYPNFRIMYLQMKKFIVELEDQERYEDCVLFTSYINKKRDEAPQSIAEAKKDLEKYNANKQAFSSPIAKMVVDIPVDIVILYNVGLIFELIDSCWLWDEKASLTKEFLEKGVQYPEHMAQELYKIYFNNYTNRVYDVY